MKIDLFSPTLVDWEKIPSEKVNGETGFALIKTSNLSDIKIRWVQYSDNYLADHWCEKGHVVHVLKGQLIVEHKDNSILISDKDKTYMVGDNSMAHRVKTFMITEVIIID